MNDKAKEVVTVTRTLTYTGMRFWVEATLEKSVIQDSRDFGFVGNIVETRTPITVVAEIPKQ